MFVCKDNWEDAAKYYQDTFIKVKELGENLLKVTGVNQKEMVVYDFISTQEYIISLENGYDIDFALPKKTVFQNGYKAAILLRIPAQQWHKGICAANTQISWLGGHGKWTANDFVITALNEFVNKTPYFTLDQALDYSKIEGHSYISLALNKRMSIHIKTGSLFVDQVKIGKFNYNKNELIIQQLFAKDVDNMLNAANKYKVISYE